MTGFPDISLVGIRKICRMTDSNKRPNILFLLINNIVHGVYHNIFPNIILGLLTPPHNLIHPPFTNFPVRRSNPARHTSPPRPVIKSFEFSMV